MKSKMNFTKITILIISILVLFAMNLSAQGNRLSSQNDSSVDGKQIQGHKNIEEEVTPEAKTDKVSKQAKKSVKETIKESKKEEVSKPIKKIAKKTDEKPVDGKQMQEHKNIEEEVAIFTQELSLTKGQIVQVTKFFTEHVEEVNKLHESNSADQSVDKSQMQKLRNEFEDKVMKILDEEQQQKFKELNKQQQSDRSQPVNQGK